MSNLARRMLERRINRACANGPTVPTEPWILFQDLLAALRESEAIIDGYSKGSILMAEDNARLRAVIKDDAPCINEDGYLVGDDICYCDRGVETDCWKWKALKGEEAK